MNTTKIYADATGKVELARDAIANDPTTHDGVGNPTSDKQKLLDKQQADAARVQAKHQWTQSTVTKEMVKHFAEKFDELIAEATATANSALVDASKKDLVISKLLRAQEVQSVIQYIINIK